MKTIHTTTHAKAQQTIEDAIAERWDDRLPSEVLTIDGPDDQQIDCLLEDIEQYAESMDADDESQEALNEKQYDMLVDNTADTDAFTGFLEWLKSEEMLIDPVASTREQRLIEFAEQVLDILTDPECSSGTLDEIASAAYDAKLAHCPDDTFTKL